MRKIVASDLYKYAKKEYQYPCNFLLELDYFKKYLSEEEIHKILYPYEGMGGREIVIPEDLKRYAEIKMKEHREKFTQDAVNEQAEKGYDLEWFAEEQIRAIPQKNINKRAEDGYDLEYFTEEQIRAIPQKIINKRAEEGRNLKWFTEEQIRDIPQKIINKTAEEGRNLKWFTEEQIKAVPRKSIVLYVVNGGNQKCLTQKQLDSIPREIKEPTEEGANALVLFGIGEIKSKDLPLDVYVNNKLRFYLLLILEDKTKREFEQICKENGFNDSSEIPEELKKSFDDRINAIREGVKKREEIGLNRWRKPLKNAVKQTMDMEW